MFIFKRGRLKIPIGIPIAVLSRILNRLRQSVPIGIPIGIPIGKMNDLIFQSRGLMRSPRPLKSLFFLPPECSQEDL